MKLLPVLEGLHSAEAMTKPFLQAFLEEVRKLRQNPARFADALQGQLIASVFEEPSTRTRLSFESAAHRLGASVITVSDGKSSSAAKGESLSDSARAIGSYADLLVWRHSCDGASRRVAQVVDVPVVNGGDGKLGHPTQTLVDLATMHQEWGSFAGKTVGILGDLRHGRTARSLAWSLAVLGARIVILPGAGLDWEAGFEKRILDRFGYVLGRVEKPLFKDWTGSPEVRILEPKGMVQKKLFGGEDTSLDSLDALYLTRLQAERGATADRIGYPGVQAEQLKDPMLQNTLLLHPLPRLQELPVSIDADPRAGYFKQAALGPTVRQVVFLALLRPDLVALPALQPMPAGEPEHALGPCPNQNCITHAEGLLPPWRVEGNHRRTFLCSYCDSPLEVHYVGCRSSKRVHPAHSPQVLQIRPENLCPFQERDCSEKEGYVWGGN